MRRVPAPPDLEWPTFGVFLSEIERLYAGRTALRYRARGVHAGAAAPGRDRRPDGRAGVQSFEEWSYARLAAEAAAVAAHLRGRRAGQGDRVALWSENQPEWAAAYLGIVAYGMVAVPIDALADTAEAAAILAASEAAALVVSAKLAEGMDTLAKGVPSLKAAVVLGSARAAAGGPGIAVASWEEAVAEGSSAGRPPLPASMSADSPASIIFTSGPREGPRASC